MVTMAGRHGAEVAESYLVIQRMQTERERLGLAWPFKTSKAQSQGHTSSKATPPNPSQTAPLTGN